MTILEGLYCFVYYVIENVFKKEKKNIQAFKFEKNGEWTIMIEIVTNDNLKEENFWGLWIIAGVLLIYHKITASLCFV